jgi:excinuclease UvrABC nuclease subunit
MSSKQQWFLAPEKPLEKRLGTDFFAQVPQCPGVYFMKDADKKTIYVGQSKNLRQRLLSYKNAHPKHTPKRTIRLVHSVHSISWETHPSATSAILRENELLRVLKPRFNRANIYPEGYKYLELLIRPKNLQIVEVPTPPQSEFGFGAFKGRHRWALGALARLVFRIRSGQSHWWQIPRHLGQSVKQIQIPIDSKNVSPQFELRTLDFINYFSGKSRHLIDQLLDECAKLPELGEFDQNWIMNDLMLVDGFYSTGPERNRMLNQMMNRESGLIEGTELNALLIRAKEPKGSSSRKKPHQGSNQAECHRRSHEMNH